MTRDRSDIHRPFARPRNIKVASYIERLDMVKLRDEQPELVNVMIRACHLKCFRTADI
jgi:hypothetical protein